MCGCGGTCEKNNNEECYMYVYVYDSFLPNCTGYAGSLADQSGDISKLIIGELRMHIALRY